MKRAGRVAVEIEGVRSVHALDPTGNYATLCGLDGDDPNISGQSIPRSPATRGEKIDCPQCFATWTMARYYHRSDFSSVDAPPVAAKQKKRSGMSPAEAFAEGQKILKGGQR
jgi:hypothetical protein